MPDGVTTAATLDSSDVAPQTIPRAVTESVTRTEFAELSTQVTGMTRKLEQLRTCTRRTTHANAYTASDWECHLASRACAVAMMTPSQGVPIVAVDGTTATADAVVAGAEHGAEPPSQRPRRM